MVCRPPTETWTFCASGALSWKVTRLSEWTLGYWAPMTFVGAGCELAGGCPQTEAADRRVIRNNGVFRMMVSIGRDCPAIRIRLLTVLPRAQVLREERHYVVLETDRDGAGVSAGIDLESIGNAVAVEDVVQLARIRAQPVLLANIHGDRLVLLQIADVLVNEYQRRVGRPLIEDFLLGIAERHVEIERRLLGIRGPRRGHRKLSGQAGKLSRLGGRLCIPDCRFHVGAAPAAGTSASAAGASGGHAARAHDVEAAENVGMLHTDPACTVAAHRVPDQTPARPLGDRSVMSIDVGDDVARNVILEVPRRNGTGVHRAVVHSLRIGQHHDHFLRTFREGSLDRLRHMDFLRPLLSADGIAVQRINLKT